MREREPYSWIWSPSRDGLHRGLPSMLLTSCVTSASRLTSLSPHLVGNVEMVSLRLQGCSKD